jgi:hypothetical protein
MRVDAVLRRAIEITLRSRHTPTLDELEEAFIGAQALADEERHIITSYLSVLAALE